MGDACEMRWDERSCGKRELVCEQEMVGCEVVSVRSHLAFGRCIQNYAQSGFLSNTVLYTNPGVHAVARTPLHAHSIPTTTLQKTSLSTSARLSRRI